MKEKVTPTHSPKQPLTIIPLNNDDHDRRGMNRHLSPMRETQLQLTLPLSLSLSVALYDGLPLSYLFFSSSILHSIDALCVQYELTESECIHGFLPSHFVVYSPTDDQFLTSCPPQSSIMY